MTGGGYQVTFRGVRGSRPTPRTDTLRYGGNTACIEIRVNPRHQVLFDCGTGLSSVGDDLGPGPVSDRFRFDIFLTHFHWDHVAGLPFFRPLYDRRNTITFHGHGWENRGLRTLLEGMMATPNFPVNLKDTDATKRFVELGDDPVTVADLVIRFARLRHPQGVTAYRIDRGGRSIVLATDHERGDPAADRALRDLAAGAAVLIHDAQYTPEEYDEHRGWGHSTWRHAVEAAREAGAGHLILYHHDPDRSDAELDNLVRMARTEFPAVEAAREGMTLSL